MNILNINNSSSLVRATIPNNIVAVSKDNHELVLRRTTYSQTLSSAFSEKVIIQYDRKLVAKIFRNNNI